MQGMGCRFRSGRREPRPLDTLGFFFGHHTALKQYRVLSAPRSTACVFGVRGPVAPHRYHDENKGPDRPSRAHSGSEVPMGASRVSRRGFVGGVATALGAIGLAPRGELWARSSGVVGTIPFPLTGPEEEYDGFAKLANNENPYGPPESVMKAMTHAMKYANRYGYP